MQATIRQYLNALEKADFDQLMTLFSDKAIVISPLYGRRPASEFYKELLEDTKQSKLKLLGIFNNSNEKSAAVNFLYEWTLANGEVNSFDCVDIFEFEKEGKIKSVKIIYDTAQTRPDFEQLKTKNK